MSDNLLKQENVNYVVADFVAPTRELRSIYEPHFCVWMDTIKEGRFEDTNKAWQIPQEDEYNIRITEFNPVEEEAHRLCNLILKHPQG
jgi:adenylylsulfate kinase